MCKDHLVKKELTIDRMMLNKSAHQNPSTTNPGTILLVNNISKALITKVNNPSVKILTGKVRASRIGFTIALIIPSTSETTRAVRKFATWTPGSI